MTEHTHKQFDAEMELIRGGVLAMGGLVEKQLTRALAALADEETEELIDAVGADEQAVNRMQMEIDQQRTQIIAKRQPAAIDLRMIMTVTKVVNDLERIGDDESVDASFHAIMRQLISYMMEDPRTISAALEILFIAKSIERVGDHAKNIAEAVVQAVRGVDVRHASAGQIRAELHEP